MSAATRPSQLYYGDNLEVLRTNVPNESVDLVYIDPPFNSNRVYNVGFDSAGDAAAQIQAFDDTWKWSAETGEAYDRMVNDGAVPTLAGEALSAVRALLKESPMTAYMVAMTPRIVELHRVLKHTGSMYLHCDPTASHYLKIMMDAVFGPACFRNEIIWRRTGAHGKVRRFGPTHDVILFYTKSSGDDYKWRGARQKYMNGHVEEYFVKDDEGWRTNYYGNVLTGSGTRGGESGLPWMGIDPTAKGRHWAIPGGLVEDAGEDFTGMTQHQKLDRLFELGFITLEKGAAWPMYQRRIKPGDGVPAPDIWAYQPYTEGTVFGTGDGIDADVRWLNPRDRERLGYPTQKPVGLLERIINASTDPGDVVLDAFCGCGTTLDAAVRTGRRWIGIDITYLAVDLIINRLKLTHGATIADTYDVLGVPADLAAAHALFARDPFDFERWAVSLVKGTPNQKKGGDQGRDGLVRFYKGKKEKPGQIVVSVKGGKQLNPAMIRDLAGVVATDVKVDAGLLVTLWPPTSGMRQEAARSGSYNDIVGSPHPRVQIMTVEELLSGTKPDVPLLIPPYTEARPVEEVVEEMLLFEM